jgi:hypothetical protein
MTAARRLLNPAPARAHEMSPEMSDSRPTADAEVRLRAAINQDGLLDLFAGIALVLATALAFAGWRVMGNPAVFAAIVCRFSSRSTSNRRENG